MSGPNAARTLPPGDRDDEAPAFDLGPALRDAPLAPQPLADDREQHVLKLTRIVPEVLRDFVQLQYAMCVGNEAAAIGALKRLDTNATEAAALSRRLLRSNERAPTKE